MRTVINCDMGEGMGNDELILPFINAANIACGYHAGNAATMRQTMETCLLHKVDIGAHISFYDRKNFGRTEMQVEALELSDLVTQQLYLFYEIAEELGVKPVHVKPHGALYNMSAKDPVVAGQISEAIKAFDPSLVLYGLSGSHSISEAKRIGLSTANEAFADRSYQEDGSLIPRSQPGALILHSHEVVQRVLQMIHEETVTTLSGKKIPIHAETICIHGDGNNVVDFAKAIYAAIKEG